MFFGIKYSFSQDFQKHTLEIGTEISHITYKEPGVMKEKGAMRGILASYTYYNDIILKTEGRYSFGKVDYSGSLSDGTLYTVDNIDDYILELRGLVKNPNYNFSLLKTSTEIISYIGIGYRYLNDDMSFDPAGYERESNYIYSPIGIEAVSNLENGWFLETILELDIFWWGKQKSHISNVSGYYDIENLQTDGYGWRSSIELQKKGEKIEWGIESFIRYWSIEESKTTTDPAGTTWVEPKNHSTEYGIKFSVRF